MPHILILDDEERIRNLLKVLLEKNKYDCALAADCTQARGILAENQFDLILCDIQMPGESGIDFARYVTSKYPDTGMVMVTVIADQKTAKTLLELGIYGYLLKPFDESQMLISVANALRRRELEIRQRSYREDLERTVQERTAEIVRMNEALVKSEKELITQKKGLEDINTALEVLLKKREQDRTALEDNILANVKGAVVPFLEKLKNTPLKREQREILGILEANIKDMISPFVKEISSPYLDLSPTEIEVANLIKQGKTTKMIANLLHVSVNTVMSHRYNIRRKLGLINNNANLRSFLCSLR